MKAGKDPFENLLAVSPELITEGTAKKAAIGRTGRPASPKEKREQTHFIKVPWSWKQRLAKATRVSTYRVALFLLYRHWRDKGQPIPVSNLAIEDEGLSPRVKSLALLELEGLGLIAIERRPGRSPRVTLLLT